MNEFNAAQWNAAEHPSLAEAANVWAKIGILSFGGPAGQIALMHRIVVDEKRWISEDRYLHALNYCMLLPGPEAQQLATYIGWLLHGWRGGMAAGLLFLLPGFVVILALSAAYALFHDTAWLPVLFFGLKAAVLAIVIDALIRIGRRALKTPLHITVAAASFVALFVFNLPFPLVIAAAGLFGFMNARRLPAGGAGVSGEETGRIGDAPPSLGRTAGTALFWILVWQAPMIALWLSGNGAFPAIFAFFSKMALVTFGGAYAVLSYVAQTAVEHYHWLKPGEMLDGLALAETTPGPLVLVLCFTGFLAAFRDTAGLDPLLAGVLGAALTAWATFVPSFIWIFAGAPYIERLRARPLLSSALSMITAAVVGVILNLAVWFALHVVFARVERLTPSFPLNAIDIAWPDFATVNLPALALSVLAAFLLFRLRLGIVGVLASCSVAGWVMAAIL